MRTAQPRRHAHRRSWGVLVATVGLTGSLLAAVSPAAAQPEGLLADPTPAIGARQAKAPTGERAAGPSSKRAAARARDGYADGVVSRTTAFTEFRPEYDGGTNDRRFARVSVAQNLLTQRLQFAATLRAAPTQESVVSALFGTWDANDSCQATAIVAGATVSTGAAAQVGTTALAAARSRTGAVVSAWTAPLAAIRSAGYECAFVRLTNPDGSTVYQSSYARDLDTNYRPVLRVDSRDASMIGATRGKWATLEVEVRNIGEPDIAAVSVTVSGAGVQVQNPTRSLGAIASGRGKYVTHRLRVKVPRKGKPKQRMVTVVARGGGVSASRRFRVVVSPRPTAPRSMVGRYYWASEPSSVADYNGWNNHTLWFVNKKFAFVGEVKGSKPACRRASRTCLRYRYNSRTGALKLGRSRAKVRTDGFSVKTPQYSGKLYWSPLVLPSKGSKVGLDLYRQDWSGYCLMTCTTWTDYLTMDRKGRFITSGSAMGSWPVMGTYWSSVSPADRGTYRMISKGILQLSYANGKRERHVFGVGLNPLGRPDPEFGVVLNATNYY